MTEKGGKPTKSKKPVSTTPKPKTKVRRRRRLNLNWPVLVIILAAAFAVAIMVNNEQKEATTIESFSNTIDIDDGDLKIKWDRYQTIDIELSQSLTITESGTYHLTGALENGQITINAGVSEVRLLLDNVTIINPTGPAIYCQNAEDLIIESVGENIIQDGTMYATNYDKDIAGAIYSKADLYFQGEGILNITGNYQDAIIGKDDVKFSSGTYNIIAADDAIHGKDSIYIVDGNFQIDSVADCLKTTNTENIGKGFILQKGGNLNLTSTSGKGLNSTKNIIIQDGYLAIDSFDDAIHSNNYAGIIDGHINIRSGDDGIHATRELIIDGGDLNITKAFEGIEAQAVTVNNGDIDITASDDGINAGGGADESSKNRPGSGPFNTDEDCVININEGNIYINAEGDGIDSNGWLYFNGGNTIVDGPTDDGNGALDSGMGIIINKGKVLAIGSSGMAAGPSNTSSVNSVNIYLSNTYPANTKIAIKDAGGNTILEHKSSKQFSNIVVGSPEIKFANTYKLYINNEEVEEFLILDVATVIGKPNQNIDK